MKNLTYQLLNQSKIAEAFEVLELNMEAFPESEKVIDSKVLYAVADQLVAAELLEEATTFLTLNLKVFPKEDKAYRIREASRREKEENL